MEDKLLGIEQRYEEIHKELAEVGQDYQRAADLGKERAEIISARLTWAKSAQNLSRSLKLIVRIRLPGMSLSKHKT
jgi:hypothetical protein